MINLTFKHIAAWNFLPFGPEGIQLPLEKYGNIILIRGENRDAKAIDSVNEQSDESKTSSNGCGKCFRKDTKILMYDGNIKLVQDVKIGDQVMGPDSLPRNVLSLGRGREMMYEIKPKKGDSYFVNQSHILTLKKMCKKKNNLPSLLNISVLDYLKLSTWKQNIYGTYRVYIFGNCDEIPTRLLRKKSRKRVINKDCLKTGIKILPVGEEDFYGFSVDKDHLFLLSDFTVVHNSSLQEIIVYGLFGKTVKQKVGKDDVVHNLVGKDCKVELIFGDYRIIRTRMDGGRKEKSTLRLWESSNGVWDKTTEKTQGTMPTTQKKIESIIGLSYDAFVNMCIFTDDQRLCFLECDNPQKKEIVENLLSLAEYREWHENAKDLRKVVKQSIDSKTKEYQLLLSNKDDAKRRLGLTEKKHRDWQFRKKNEISLLENRIIDKKKELASTDAGAALIDYQEAQSTITSINDSLPALEISKADFEKKLSLAKEKESELKIEAQGLTKQYEEFSSTAKNKLNDRKKKESEISDLESNKPGTQCGKCRSVVEEENIVQYVNKLKLEINNINLDIQAAMLSAKEIAAKTEDLKLRQNKVSTMITAINSKINSIDAEFKSLQNKLVFASKVREPKADSAEALLEQEISQIKNLIESKNTELSGRSPYQDIIDNDILELDKITNNVSNKEIEIKDLEKELPYLDYWIYGFGDHGIRKWVVEGIVPELNNRINYWLQFLIDNKITLKFDNELNESIERNPVDGNPYVYHAMSTGQRRRLNLAVSQSFAHVMTISSGSVPSVVFLDEVSTNVDPLGVQGIYNMICELAEDKQVFVTTHDPDLMRMIQGSDVIQLVHENGYTKLVENSC